MWRKLRHLGAWIVIATVVHGAEPQFTGLTIDDVKTLLPPPPRADSAETASEMETLLHTQETRTDADFRRAQSEHSLSPAAFQTVLGSEFTADKCPEIFDLLVAAEDDSKFFTSQMKTYFARPRPATHEPRLKAPTEHDFAYPSGHSTRGMLWALVLSEIRRNRGNRCSHADRKLAGTE